MEAYGIADQAVARSLLQSRITSRSKQIRKVEEALATIKGDLRAIKAMKAKPQDFILDGLRNAKAALKLMSGDQRLDRYSMRMLNVATYYKNRWHVAQYGRRA